MLSKDALVNGIRFGMCGYTADGQNRPYSQRFIKSIKWNLQQPEWQTDPATGEKYWVNPTLLGWVEAEEQCQAAGASLAKVASTEENAFVTALAGVGLSQMWIGCNDRTFEGTFVWTDGTACPKPTEGTGFSNWKTGEPNSGNDEDCVELYRSRSSNFPYAGEWNDDSCSKKQLSICQLWQPDAATWERVERKTCTGSTETSLSYKKNTGCNGWSGQTLQQCQEHCAQNDVASGCTVVHGNSVCTAFVHYELTGWCHVLSACDSLLNANTATTYKMKLTCTGCAAGYACSQTQGKCMPSSTQQEPQSKENTLDETANNRSQTNPTNLTDEDSTQQEPQSKENTFDETANNRSQTNTTNLIDEDSQISPDQLGSKSGGNSGRIIGIVVAAVLVLVGLFVLFCWKYKQAKEAAMTKELKGAKTTAYNNPHFDADPNSRCQQCGSKTTQCICRQRAESIAQGNIPKIAAAAGDPGASAGAAAPPTAATRAGGGGASIYAPPAGLPPAHESPGYYSSVAAAPGTQAEYAAPNELGGSGVEAGDEAVGYASLTKGASAVYAGAGTGGSAAAYAPITNASGMYAPSGDVGVGNDGALYTNDAYGNVPGSSTTNA